MIIKKILNKAFKNGKIKMADYTADNINYTKRFKMADDSADEVDFDEE